jgi:hypothetical protein
VLKSGDAPAPCVLCPEKTPVPRGSRFQLPSSEPIVAGISWIDSDYDCVDLDATAILYNEEGQIIHVENYSNYGGFLGIQYSGDRTSAPAPLGASEYFLLDPTALFELDVRTIGIYVASYSGQSLKDVSNLYGYITSIRPDSGFHDGLDITASHCEPSTFTPINIATASRGVHVAWIELPESESDTVSTTLQCTALGIADTIAPPMNGYNTYDATKTETPLQHMSELIGQWSRNNSLARTSHLVAAFATSGASVTVYNSSLQTLAVDTAERPYQTYLNWLSQLETPTQLTPIDMESYTIPEQGVVMFGNFSPELIPQHATVVSDLPVHIEPETEDGESSVTWTTQGFSLL